MEHWGIEDPVTLALSWTGEGRSRTVHSLLQDAALMTWVARLRLPYYFTEATGGRCVLTVLAELPS